MVPILQPLVGTISESHIVNSQDLLNKLKFPMYKFKLISFDVASLFTNVPVDDLLTFFREKFKDNIFCIEIDLLVRLIELCVKDCKFQFNDDFYSMKFGLAMGNPLSPILANLYMEYFETVILKSTVDDLNLNFKLVWYRYIDDIICLWPDGCNVNNFLAKMNVLVPTINFTMEIEVDNKMPFLDILIHRCVDCFKFEVFRKATNNNSYLHFYSNHNMGTKIGVFVGMYLRALRITSPEFLDAEFSKIREIGLKLCYPNEILDRSITKAKKCFYRIDNTNKQVFKHILNLPFHVNFLHVPRLLSKIDIKVVFHYATTVKGILIKNSPHNLIGCIYSIGCQDCNLLYVGQTGKTLETRVGQHKGYCRNLKWNSALFRHAYCSNHRIDWNSARAIFKNRDMTERNILESVSIQCNTRMNLSSGLYNIDCILTNFILNMYPNLKL